MQFLEMATIYGAFPEFVF